MLHRLLIGLALAAALVAPAHSEPAYFYQFFLKSISSCPLPADQPNREAMCAAGVQRLNEQTEALSLTVSLEGARNGSAFLRNTNGLLESDGIIAATGLGFAIDVRHPEQLPIGPIDIDLVDVGVFLSGSYSKLAGPDRVFMGGTTTSWGGIFDSDAVLWSSLYAFFYYGEWRLTQVIQVPEPSSIALLGLGLAGLAFTRRRKH